MTETKETTATQPWTTDPLTELDRWFDAVLGRTEAARGLRPAATDVADTGAAFRLTTELPGIPKDRLDIVVRGTTVEIRAEAETERTTSRPELLYRERNHRGFYRAVELPEPILADQAKATFTDGVLSLELPKEHPVRPPQEVHLKVA